MRLHAFCTLKLRSTHLILVRCLILLGFLYRIISWRDYFSNLHICKFYALLHWLGPPAHCEAEVVIVGLVPSFEESSFSL